MEKEELRPKTATLADAVIAAEKQRTSQRCHDYSENARDFLCEAPGSVCGANNTLHPRCKRTSCLLSPFTHHLEFIIISLKQRLIRCYVDVGFYAQRSAFNVL